VTPELWAIIEAMQAMLAKLGGFRKGVDSDIPFRVFVVEMGTIGLDGIRRYEDAGATDMIVVFRNLYAVEEDQQPLSQKVDDLNRFGDEVLANM